MNIGQIHQFLGSVDRFISNPSAKIKNAAKETIQAVKPLQSSRVDSTPITEKSVSRNHAVSTYKSASYTNSAQNKPMSLYGRHGEIQTQKASVLGQHFDVKV